MSSLIRLRRLNRKPCVGDLDKQVILQNRKLVEPVFGETQYAADFSAKA